MPNIFFLPRSNRVPPPPPPSSSCCNKNILLKTVETWSANANTEKKKTEIVVVKSSLHLRCYVRFCLATSPKVRKSVGVVAYLRIARRSPIWIFFSLISRRDIHGWRSVCVRVLLLTPNSCSNKSRISNRYNNVVVTFYKRRNQTSYHIVLLLL